MKRCFARSTAFEYSKAMIGSSSIPSSPGLGLGLGLHVCMYMHMHMHVCMRAALTGHAVDHVD